MVLLVQFKEGVGLVGSGLVCTDRAKRRCCNGSEQGEETMRRSLRVLMNSTDTSRRSRPSTSNCIPQTLSVETLNPKKRGTTQTTHPDMLKSIELCFFVGVLGHH